MATMACVRRSHVLALVLGLAVGAPAAFAEDSESKGSPTIAGVVKPGDTVAVTRWSGGKLKGQVVEVTACSLVLRAVDSRVDIPADAIKTVRRYPHRRQDPGARAMLDLAADCQHAGCAPETAAVVGIAALFKGFHDLGRRAKIVYRGKRDRPAAPACAGETGTMMAR
jgi:hypothetical protein